jgi:hypothetical protein
MTAIVILVSVAILAFIGWDLMRVTTPGDGSGAGSGGDERREGDGDPNNRIV